MAGNVEASATSCLARDNCDRIANVVEQSELFAAVYNYGVLGSSKQGPPVHTAFGDCDYKSTRSPGS